MFQIQIGKGDLHVNYVHLGIFYFAHVSLLMHNAQEGMINALP